MRRLVVGASTCAVLALIGCTSTQTGSSAGQSWTVEKTINRGEKIQIQQMYFINKTTCEADEIPPAPEVKQEPVFGQLEYRSGPTNPHQCPTITINANFADYTAGA